MGKSNITRFLPLILVILFSIVDHSFGACGICGSKSGVVCRDQKTFSFCRDDNTVSGERYSCPSGTNCGNDYRICAPNPYEPCNPLCGTCTERFACMSERTYALCFGQGYPSDQIFECPVGYFCSTQKNSTSGLEFCFSRISLGNHEIDCFKDVFGATTPSGSHDLVNTEDML